MTYTVDLLPDGPGQYTELNCSSPPNWSRMALGGDTQKVYSSGTGYTKDLYNFQVLPTQPGDTITKISVSWRARYSNVTGVKAKSMIRSNTTEVYGAEQTPPSSWTTYTTDYATDPATGVAWTKAGVDAVQAGVAGSVAGGVDFAWIKITVTVEHWLGRCFSRIVGNIIKPVQVAASYTRKIRIPVSFTVAGAQTDYVKELTIVRGAGVSSAGVIYLNNQSMNWPYDIRFTASDGVTALDFYREESDATDGTWHVKLDSIAASGDTDFYLFTGCWAGADESDGPNTFVVFDNFGLGDLSRWDAVGTNWRIDGITKFSGDYSAKGTPGATERIIQDATYCKSCVMHVRLLIDVDAAAISWPMLLWTENGPVYPLGTEHSTYYYYDGSTKPLPVDTTFTPATWDKIEVAADLENSLFRWWVNGASKGTATLKDAAGTTLTPADSFGFAGAQQAPSGINVYLDDMWIRKYIYPEPAWAAPGAWGAV